MHRDSSAPPSGSVRDPAPSSPPGAAREPGRLTAAVLLLVLLLLALVVRLPTLHDADYRFTSDEAVDALVMRHLLSGRELTLFNWDSTYYGIAEGLLTLPFLALLGQTAAAFKLGAIAGHWLLMVAVYLLAARLAGRCAGLLAAATLVAFSPALFYWSTLASGGYCLVVAIGAFAFWQLDRVEAEPTPRRLVALGVLCGFGFYVYQLFLVFLAALALWALARAAGAASLGSKARRLALFAGGFVVGAAPVLARHLTGAAGGGKEPSFLIASANAVSAHARLLLQYAAPTLLGARSWNGPLSWDIRLAGLAFALLMVGGWVVAAWEALARLRRAPGSGLLREGFDTRTLLVLLVPLVALLFVLSRNTQDVTSNRYLLTWLAALPVLAGELLARGWRRGVPARLVVGALLLAPIFSTTVIATVPGSPGRRWLITHREPLLDVVADLERRGIHDGYAHYWTAYKATFLAAERVVLAPANSWDRYPPYTARVDAAPREAYVFAVDPPNVGTQDARDANAERERFEAKLAAAEVAVDRRDIGFYRVYSAVGPTRLLPPPKRQPVVALARPAADLRPVDPPTVLAAGAETRIRVAITNRSDAFWSADGVAKLAGSARVAASYRWLDAQGGTAVVVEGVRTPLPYDLDPGETATVAVRIAAPPTPGRYQLRLTLVQENVAWFDQATGSQATLQIDVR